MEKATVKVRRDKKKNTQTGILMGQTTNIFSQLSATYLQHKSSVNQDESSFLEQTQIVEYHDPNINRLILLLRKKAEVTKVKAVQQLRQEVTKMNGEQVEQFILTFAHLFLEMTLNEQSKQVVDELLATLIHLLNTHKKIVVKQITTLHAPFLLSLKLYKALPLLFTGEEDQQIQKMLRLSMKKQVCKKFIVVTKMILESEQTEKVILAHYQRNCCSLIRVIKDFVKYYQECERAKDLEKDFASFLNQISQSLTGPCVEQYFKTGGKAKAAILSLHATLLACAAKHPSWNLNRQYYAKTLGQSFLDKDPVVQQTLWKLCNQSMLESLSIINEDINNYLPKSQQKLLQVLKIGGFSMYKQLPNYCQVFPTSHIGSQTHKSMINKLNFIRKLMQSILDQQDQNEARVECYYQLAVNFIKTIRSAEIKDQQQKKIKQINSLSAKTEKQLIENLQSKYYKNPPLSRNHFSYHIPHFFTKIIAQTIPNFDLHFDQNHTFALFTPLPQNQSTVKYIDQIYQKCTNKQNLLLQFLQNFGRRHVEVDMTQLNPEIETAAKIFILGRDQQWFQQKWDIRKKIIAYDPRITVRDLQNEEQSHFRPNNKKFAIKIYDMPELDQLRFQFFLDCLLDKQWMTYVKFLTPMVSDYLLNRNKQCLIKLLKIYTQKGNSLQQGKWMISEHEVLIIRSIGQLIIGYLQNKEIVQNQLLSSFFISYLQFSRILFNYKMEPIVEQMLRNVNTLLSRQIYNQWLMDGAKKSIKICYNQLLSGSIDSLKEKIRKNRLNRCVQFISKVVWYCLRRNGEDVIDLFMELVKDDKIWIQATVRVEPWAIGMSILGSQQNSKIGKQLTTHYKQNLSIIGLILSAQSMLPLQNHLQIRKMYVGIKRSIENQVNVLEKNVLGEVLSQLQKSALQKEEVSLGEGIKNLIHYLLLENEQDNTQLLQVLGHHCLQKPFNIYFKKPRTISNTLIITHLLSIIPLRKVDQTLPVYQQLIQNLNKQPQGLQYLKLVSICCVFWNKGVANQELLLKQNQQSLIERVLKTSFASISQQHINFSIYAIFSLINTASSLSRELLQPHWKTIWALFWQSIKQGTQMHGLAQSTKMKFATRAITSNLEQKRLIQQIPRLAVQQYLFYKDLLIRLQEDGNLPHHQDIVNLFVEVGEFIFRASNCQQQPQETVILELMGCPFEGVRRGCFILLKKMYERKQVERQPPKIYHSLLSLQLKQEELDPIQCGNFSGYLYAWQILILRRNSIEKSSGSQQQSTITLEQYIQNDNLAISFLQNTFQLIDQNLQYLSNESSYQITVQDVLQDDLAFEQDTDPKQKLFRMTIRTLFLFVLNFPLFLRDFIDQNKKYRPLCERLLRTVITDAIFRSEVNKIQLGQGEWKGSNFDIYVTSKNKQIYAQYTHDVIRLGLRLVMRGSYPLIPIAIQFGEGLKMEESSRWVLQLQSQLHSRNNTILNGILLWKQNIDRKLQGVQQCAICFDVVNTNGQLPKKGCKTCKKKFHGNCVLKWFSKSNKSECPLCKSQFL